MTCNLSFDRIRCYDLIKNAANLNITATIVTNYSFIITNNINLYFCRFIIL